MASDQQVGSQIILKTLMEVRRVTAWRLIEQLERVEPDLTEFILESLSAYNQRLMELGAPHKQTRRLYHDVQNMLVVCVTALRNAHFQLWREQAADTPLATLDSTIIDNDLGDSGSPDAPGPPQS